MYKKVARTFNDLGITYSQDPEVLAAYSVDESIFSIMPQMVVTPQNKDEVVKIVRTVRDYTKVYPEISLTVRAAGTGLAGGPLNDSIVMDVMNLDSFAEFTEATETSGELVVEPGVYFRDIEDMLDEVGHIFHPYPSSKDICTIGGMVANNAAGPNSLKYGHTADSVTALEVVLADGELVEIGDISYKELEMILEQDGALADIYRFVWNELVENGQMIRDIRPESSKNSAGYALGDVLQSDSVESFKEGKGTLNLAPAFCGSQGTLGVIVEITLKTKKKTPTSDLLVIPIYRLNIMGDVTKDLLKLNPYNIEIYDDISYKLALKNPGFFKKRSDSFLEWIGFVCRMYFSFLFVMGGKVPLYTLLVKFDAQSSEENARLIKQASLGLEKKKVKHKVVKNRKIREVFWRIRESSYSLAKLASNTSRPAAFLEDMVVPPQEIPEFLREVKEKLKAHNLSYAMHGHGGNGHFHFYPLFDFTNEETPEKIYTIAHEFYELAKKHKGNICGEHNDGIMRTPFLGLIYTEQELDIFRRFEFAADPDDIFNPGKKVNPKFDIRGSMRSFN